MSRIITDSKVSGQYYIPSLSLSRYEKRKKKNVGTRKKTKQSVKVAPGVVSRRRHRRSSSPSSSFPACSAGTASSETQGFCFWNVFVPPRNRRFKRGIIGKKYSAPFFVCLCACIFSSKKRRQNTSPSEQNKPYYLHALLPNKARWCILHVSFENATTFTRQHPSIHPSDDDALLLLPDRNADHHRRCKTLERERERDNLLIVQRRREEKILREKKKGGNFVLRLIENTFAASRRPNPRRL